MKKMLNLFFVFIFLNSFSQVNYEYFGAVKLNGSDKSIISYRLFFSEQNGVVNGYSVTDLGGNNETKNIISGFYNKKTKELIFKEESILYTKSSFSESMFCFINFSGKVKLVENSSKLEGNFKGMYKNKKKCIDGTLMLVGSVKLYKLLDKINTRVQKSKKIDVATKEKVNPISILDSLKINTLTKDQNLNVFVNSSEIQMEIWDAKIEDGDKIDVFLNGRRILENFTVTNKKKIITVKLEAAKNIFRIEALNEGERRLNTAMMQLIDNNRNFELSTNLKKGEKTSITLFKNN